MDQQSEDIRKLKIQNHNNEKKAKSRLCSRLSWSEKSDIEKEAELKALHSIYEDRLAVRLALIEAKSPARRISELCQTPAPKSPPRRTAMTSSVVKAVKARIDKEKQASFVE